MIGSWSSWSEHSFSKGLESILVELPEIACHASLHSRPPEGKYKQGKHICLQRQPSRSKSLYFVYLGWKSRDSVTQLATNNEVQMTCVIGHCNAKRNDKAAKLAKQSTNMHFDVLVTFFRFFKNKKLMEDAWLSLKNNTQTI